MPVRRNMTSLDELVPYASYSIRISRWLNIFVNASHKLGKLLSVLGTINVIGHSFVHRYKSIPTDPGEKILI